MRPIIKKQQYVSTEASNGNGEVSKVLNAKEQAHALYLQGNTYRRQQQWSEALNAYEAAMALDDESPAKAAREMLMGIMEYYCKDYYNP